MLVALILAACSGISDGTADPGNSSALSAWTQCATENGICTFSGSREVRYGANGTYVTRTVTNSVSCSNAVFGDPLVGVVKHCDLGTETVSSTWTQCAVEHATCAVTGTKQVRYGANNTYVTRTVTNSVSCSNAVFGDPLVGIVKHCDVGAGAIVPPSSPATDMASGSAPDLGSTTAHPFPFSFDDSQFFANVTASAPINVGCTQTRSDLSITAANDGQPVVTNACEGGTSTIQRVRLGGDAGNKGNVREGYRCGGHGTMNIYDSWLEATGVGDDHADVIQCYDPNNSPTAVMNLKNTTIRAHEVATNAGLFVADSYAMELHVTNVLFWGGPFGLRFHTDGRPGSLYMNDVCFYGTGANDNSFGYAAFLFDPYPPTFVEWNNVNWCTIDNGKLVVHGAIPRP